MSTKSRSDKNSTKAQLERVREMAMDVPLPTKPETVLANEEIYRWYVAIVRSRELASWSSAELGLASQLANNYYLLDLLTAHIIEAGSDIDIIETISNGAQVLSPLIKAQGDLQKLSAALLRTLKLTNVKDNQSISRSAPVAPTQASQRSNKVSADVLKLIQTGQ